MTHIENHIVLRSEDSTLLVVSRTSDAFIASPGDFLNMLAWGGERDTSAFVLKAVNFTAAFYDLRTGLAGEILQKVSNYRCRLAIVGPFSMVTSERFREFMSESNKGRQVCFARGEEEARVWLAKTRE